MSRPTVVLGSLIVAALLLFHTAQAAVVEVDVTIKSVDVKARAVSVTYEAKGEQKIIDLDVSRKAEITVNGKAGTLDGVKPGQKAKVSFEKELQVVTKIDATGEGKASADDDPFGAGAGRPVSKDEKSLELVELAELNDGNQNDHAWLSEDGLTIYWDRASGPKGTIWTAHRENPESPFADEKSLFAGKCATVSSDGLEMILVGNRTDGQQGMSLQVATRESLKKPFTRPQEIASLQSYNAWSPYIAADGLTLYFSLRGNRTLSSTRKDKNSPWSKAKVYAPPGLEEVDVNLSFITSDGLTLFGQTQKTLVTLSRSSTATPFQEPMPIKAKSRPLFGWWPRYVSATHELFFVRMPLKDGAWDKAQPVGLWVVKNFTLPDASK